MNDHIFYPFSAIVGQEELKLALILNVINPSISGVLIRGEKGTGKSTAVRALAGVLPEIDVIKGSPFGLDPRTELDVHEEIQRVLKGTGNELHEGDIEITRCKVKVVELPIGATEDRVVGTLDVQHALKTGERRFEPGILARAHRNILYVDEVNLLDDHVVDILLDASAMGVNTVEREGVSFWHPSRFTLVGTMNPEEGELRPQLLDRFGLCVTVRGSRDVRERVEIMTRRLEFDKDPEGFCRKWRREDEMIRERILRARKIYPEVVASHEVLESIARVSMDAGVDGHRADIVMLKTAKALCAWHGMTEVQEEHVREAASLAIPHRTRRLPMMEMTESLEEILGDVGTHGA